MSADQDKLEFYLLFQSTFNAFDGSGQGDTYLTSVSDFSIAAITESWFHIFHVTKHAIFHPYVMYKTGLSQHHYF